jgi:hypothetical protein
MGAKTGVLVFADAEVPAALRAATVLPDRERVEALVHRVHPGYDVEYVDNMELFDAVYPPDDHIYVTSVGGVDVLCDQRFMIDHPSRLPGHLLDLAEGRRVILHAMHSVVDWFAFAVWENGVLVRSLSLSPDDGIIENIGEPFEFERPFWAGEHPVQPVPGWLDQGPYPLPFHPLELGEEALRALFGFVIEGRPEPTDLDPFAVPMYGFRASDPTGREQAVREQALAHVRSQAASLRFSTYVDGVMVEAGSLDELVGMWSSASSSRAAAGPSPQEGVTGAPDRSPNAAEAATPSTLRDAVARRPAMYFGPVDPPDWPLVIVLWNILEALDLEPADGAVEVTVRADGRFASSVRRASMLVSAHAQTAADAVKRQFWWLQLCRDVSISVGRDGRPVDLTAEPVDEYGQRRLADVDIMVVASIDPAVVPAPPETWWANWLDRLPELADHLGFRFTSRQEVIVVDEASGTHRTLTA